MTETELRFEDRVSDLRSFRRGLIIEVLEGEGEEESPFRTVIYVFDAESLNFIGRINSYENPASVAWMPWKATG